MISKNQLNNPLILALLMIVYGLVIGGVIYLFSMMVHAEYTYTASGGLVGALLAGSTYVSKCRKLPSIKLRLEAVAIYFLFQALLNFIYFEMGDLSFERFWKLTVIVNLIYVLAVFFMVSLGASNHLKSLKRMEKYRKDE